MAGRRKWTDDQVEKEIARLKASEYVRLAKKEAQIRNKRKQYMWSLQYMEARGKQLASEGITPDNMESRLFGGSVEDMEGEA